MNKGFSFEPMWRGEVFTHNLHSGFYYKVCAMDHKMLGMGDTNFEYYISPVEYVYTKTIAAERNQEITFQCETCLDDYNLYETLMYFSKNCSEELIPYMKLNISSPSFLANPDFRINYIQVVDETFSFLTSKAITTSNIQEYFDQYNDQFRDSYGDTNYTFTRYNEADEIEYFVPYHVNFTLMGEWGT